MISIESLIADVCDTFGGSAHTEGILFIPEFPATKQDLPLLSPVVSVGVDEVSVTPEDERVSIGFGSSPSKVRLKLLICVPKNKTGTDCYGVLDSVMSATAALLNKYTLLSVTTGQMKYSSTINGLVLPLDIVISAGHAFVP